MDIEKPVFFDDNNVPIVTKNKSKKVQKKALKTNKSVGNEDLVLSDSDADEVDVTNKKKQESELSASDSDEDEVRTGKKPRCVSCKL